MSLLHSSAWPQMTNALSTDIFHHSSKVTTPIPLLLWARSEIIKGTYLFGSLRRLLVSLKNEWTAYSCGWGVAPHECELSWHLSVQLWDGTYGGGCGPRGVRGSKWGFRYRHGLPVSRNSGCVTSHPFPREDGEMRVPFRMTHLATGWSPGRLRQSERRINCRAKWHHSPRWQVGLRKRAIYVKEFRLWSVCMNIAMSSRHLPAQQMKGLWSVHISSLCS